MQDKNELKSQIEAAMAKIESREASPKETGIGALFTEYKLMDRAGHDEMVVLYKPIAAAYFEQNPKEKRKQPKSKIEREIESLVNTIQFGDDDFDEEDELKSTSKARAVREATEKLEGRKKKAKKKPTRDPNAPRVRNRTTYTLNGEGSYGKGKLVLAIVKSYVDSNPDISMSDLNRAFPDELLRTYGIFKPVGDAQERRFFLKDDQLIDVAGQKVAVCNQFTSDNIVPFFDQAKRLGYDIAENKE